MEKNKSIFASSIGFLNWFLCSACFLNWFVSTTRFLIWDVNFGVKIFKLMKPIFPYIRGTCNIHYYFFSPLFWIQINYFMLQGFKMRQLDFIILHVILQPMTRVWVSNGGASGVLSFLLLEFLGYEEKITSKWLPFIIYFASCASGLCWVREMENIHWHI